MDGVAFAGYQGGAELDAVVRLIEQDLSEPYSIFTYHYFLLEHQHLCRTAWSGGELVGVVIGKIGLHRASRRGYIGMLVVASAFRGRGIASRLVLQLVEIMIREGVDEIVLETEVGNATALTLYAKLGFIREKRLANYYLNGSDAFRLKLWTTSAALLQSPC